MECAEYVACSDKKMQTDFRSKYADRCVTASCRHYMEDSGPG